MSQETLYEILNNNNGHIDEGIKDGKIKLNDLIRFKPTETITADQFKNFVFNTNTIKLIYEKSPGTLFGLVKRFLYKDWDNNASFATLCTIISSQKNYNLKLDDYGVLQKLLRASGGEMPEKTWQFLLNQKVNDLNAKEIVKCYNSFANTRKALPVEIDNILSEHGYFSYENINKIRTNSDWAWHIIKHHYPEKSGAVIYKIPQNPDYQIPYPQNAAILFTLLMVGNLNVEQLSYLTKLDCYSPKINWVWGAFSPDSIDVLIPVLSTKNLLSFLNNQTEISFNNIKTIFKTYDKEIKKDPAFEDAIFARITPKVIQSKQWQNWLQTQNLNFLNIRDDPNTIKHILKNHIKKELNSEILLNIK